MRIGVRVALLKLLLGAMAPAAQAAWTPQQCDVDVKYWCMMVCYDDRTVYDRSYRGGINGGSSISKTGTGMGRSGSTMPRSGPAPGIRIMR